MTDIKKTIQNNLDRIFGKFRSVYEKYILKPCPSSETKSKKLTAWITQIIKVRQRDKTIKNKDISLKSFLKINFFIEI
tara:strand:- start:242 stop:475 length:234 start_codon:yes stop_codon:yes gene_type:complete